MPRTSDFGRSPCSPRSSRERSILASLVALSIALTTQAGSTGGDLKSSVDEIFSSLNRSDAPGCAVAVIKEGRVVHERGYGMANLEYGVAITPDTVFYIASLSKQFTAAAVALLVEEGKISLQDDLRKYVPEIPIYPQPVRVRHLVHHTSGLKDYLGLWHDSGRSYADSIPEDQAIALIARQEALEFTPGSKFSYSNSGYFLMSVIVKRVSGMSLAQFTERKIFAPLGMKDTHFHDDRTRIVPNRATAYYQRSAEQGGGLGIFQTSFDLVGDGGLFTTVRDMVRWDQNFYHNVVGRSGLKLIQQLLSTEPLNDGTQNSYAFGLRHQEVEGRNAVLHGGAFIGFKAYYARLPQQRLSVVTLCNGNDIRAQDLNRAALRAALAP